MPSRSMKQFLDGYHQFRDTYFRENEQMIRELMDRGQKPKALMIACSDSRIDPSLKFGAGPGDMFIIRNVAALVPPYEPDGEHHGTSAALEFAVRGLEVENIIIMGHARCGGIHALMHQPNTGDFISAWMNIADDAKAEALSSKLDPSKAQVFCEQEAVKVSLRNLLTFPWVKERVDAGKLLLHGWYFDLGTGTLHILREDGTFTPA
jgi:carbonic anhydrase